MYTKYIPDCYWNSISNGYQISHEAICVLNTTNTDAHIELTLYFEDREKMTGFKVDCGAERTIHIRMDQLVNDKGETVPQDVPYATKLESNVEISVQYSRVDTSQKEYAFGTTIC